MKKIFFLILGLTLAYFLILFSSKGYLLPFYHDFYSPQSYQKLLESQKAERQDLKQEDSIQRKILFLEHTDKIFRFWYGTTWDLNGMSQTPGRGKIACGYFVTTVLEDLGIKLERIRLSQMPSEKMIATLINPRFIYKYIGLDFDVFLEKLLHHGDGLYIVGLDTHTGFLWVEKGDIRFIHSSKLPPSCVLSEDAKLSPTLKKSNYRIIAKISENNAFLKK